MAMAMVRRFAISALSNLSSRTHRRVAISVVIGTAEIAFFFAAEQIDGRLRNRLGIYHKVVHLIF